MTIIVHQDGTYDGGEYFGTFEIPVGDGETVDMGHGVAHNVDDDGEIAEMDTDVSEEEAEEWDEWWGVVEWTGGYKEVELWECEECYADE